MTTTKIVFFVLLIVASLVMTANANPFKKAAADQCIPYTSRAGQLCDTTTRCVPGYVCVDGTCEVLKYYSGRSCESTSQCLSIATYANAYCFEGKCVFTGRYEGDFCLDDTQCRSRRCTKNKCTAIPVGSTCNTGKPTEFCTMGAICLQQNCTRLNGLGESCFVSGDNTISGQGCISPYVCDTKQNKCVKPVTALGASCSPDIANQCSPSSSRYCRKVATDVYQCAQYQGVEQACDSVNDVQCEKGLSCDSSQQKCVVPYKICTSTATNECAGNEKCFCRSASAGGYCGTFAQRNCARDYTLFNSCLTANCNPYIAPVNTDGETVIIIADRSSCIHRKCGATFLQYYNCMKKDLADRSISIPSIQGYNSAPVAQSLQMMTVLVALLMYYLL